MPTQPATKGPLDHKIRPQNRIQENMPPATAARAQTERIPEVGGSGRPQTRKRRSDGGDRKNPPSARIGKKMESQTEDVAGICLFEKSTVELYDFGQKAWVPLPKPVVVDSGWGRW